MFRHLAEYKPTIVLLAVLGMISALANGTVPYIIGRFLDSLINISNSISIGGVVVAAWLAMLVLWILVQLIANFVDWIMNRKGGVFGMNLRLGYQSNAFSHMLYLPLSFHKDTKIGELGDFIGRTSWQIGAIGENVLVRLTPPILSVVVGVTMTLLINPVFTMVLLAGVVVYVVTLVKIIVPTTSNLEEGHVAWGEAYADAFQSLENIQSVKHMAAEEYEAKRIKSSFMKRTAGLWHRLEFIWSNINFYQRIVVLAVQATIFFLAVQLIQQGTLTIGELVAVNGYAALLIGPFVILGHNWQVLHNGLVNIRRAEEKIFSVTPENYHPENAYTPKKINGDVEFRNVSFAYNDSSLVLSDLNFNIAAKERVALVGKSGVGKSTAIDLISAYYFPTKGKVLIDGRDTREFDLTALRSGIAIVPQEPVLFNDTVMMNIKYGRLGATDEEAIDAAKKAHAHDFIEELPKKYNQLVGERGVKLSVGQKQRVAIARAILRDPAILILDEPTSALDAETEKFLAETFEVLMKGRTTFIIAHRLSTVRRADRIFVFEGGRIVEEGKHEDLIKLKDGVYRRLHEYQVGTHNN